MKNDMLPEIPRLRNECIRVQCIPIGHRQKAGGNIRSTLPQKYQKVHLLLLDISNPLQLKQSLNVLKFLLTWTHLPSMECPLMANYGKKANSRLEDLNMNNVLISQLLPKIPPTEAWGINILCPMFYNGRRHINLKRMVTNNTRTEAHLPFNGSWNCTTIG